jgi:asparagine synthase (glutamine-hydrolysing)
MTATAARLQPAGLPRRDPDALAPAALSGSVDLLALEPGRDVEWRDFEHEVLLFAPGLALRFDARRTGCHATPGAVTFVIGRPRIGGEDATPEDVDRVLRDSAVPWQRIGGRFAIARVDLAAGDVLLATDRFGVWPLTWSRQGPRIAFSDRADCVPTSDDVELDPQSIFDYVYFHMIPSPRTVYRGVQRVEPATAVRLSCIAVEQQPTWRADFTATRPADEAMEERFRVAVRDAVLGEADDGATGCFLSGGTDSSTVAGMLARERGSTSTFSIGFDAEGYDEMSYARIAAKHFGTDHHEYYVTPDDLVGAIPLVARHYDQPFGNSSAVPAYYCALMAQHHGVTTILAGDGGDELFGGNLRYARQKVFEEYRRVPRTLRTTLVEPLLDNRIARGLPGVAKASSYVTQARVPMPARMETYNLLARFGAGSVFSRRFLEQVDAAAPAALQERVYDQHRDAPFVDRMLAYDWRFTLADNDLPKVTGTTRLAGLDVGFPLLADALVDLSTGLTAADKVRGMQLRHFFKQSLRNFLPPEIIAKKKHGFGLPVGPWLVTSSAFRALAYESLNGLVDRGLIRAELVDDLFSRRLEEHPGYYGEMVWVLMMLEQWLRGHAPAWSCR